LTGGGWLGGSTRESVNEKRAALDMRQREGAFRKRERKNRKSRDESTGKKEITIARKRVCRGKKRKVGRGGGNVAK